MRTVNRNKSNCKYLRKKKLYTHRCIKLFRTTTKPNGYESLEFIVFENFNSVCFLCFINSMPLISVLCVVCLQSSTSHFSRHIKFYVLQEFRLIQNFANVSLTAAKFQVFFLALVLFWRHHVEAFRIDQGYNAFSRIKLARIINIHKKERNTWNISISFVLLSNHCDSFGAIWFGHRNSLA